VLLSTKCVTPFSRLITTAWEKTTSSLPAEKTVWIGSPVRGRAGANPALLKQEGIALDPTVPTVLVFGGGGGARWLNETIRDIQADLSIRANVVLLSGPKQGFIRVQDPSGRVHCVERLVDAMPEVLRAAEVVVCRAGMGTIAELAHFQKAAILIPIPGSAQEENARELQNTDAAVVLDQAQTTPQLLRDHIFALLNDPGRSQALGVQLSRTVPTDIAAHLVHLIQTRCFK
jgi:UDP-N-acetylglucosamine--N-acetylmuramyl-(pentapeptide) pyrophosphoryl-undecaprenol N-acetylglucosamine transferase